MAQLRTWPLPRYHRRIGSVGVSSNCAAPFLHAGDQSVIPALAQGAECLACSGCIPRLPVSDSIADKVLHRGSQRG